MKAKLGNKVVEVWQIDPKAGLDAYPAWLKDGLQRRLINWHRDSEMTPAKGGGNLMGAMYDKMLKGESFKKPDILFDDPLRDTLTIASAFMPVIGYAGDWLIYNENSNTKYEIFSKKDFEKKCDVLA
ncbi:MAG: hypothetical protein LBI43_02610 [Streptococcaceae bacterium]|jgi:hypothetical protein|nr:hypothetical protein [Streptococcaceae bacterium]